jgi:hypothetical protein
VGSHPILTLTYWNWLMKNLCKISILMLLIPSAAQAELSAEAVLNQVYDSYDKKHDCWLTTDNEKQRYCMKLDHSAKIDTAAGQRLYVLAAGDWIDAQGENTAGHGNSGLVGAFVVEEQQGKPVILHSNAQITMGSFGIAPTGWVFVKLGAEDYWGWHNITGWTGQGYTFGYYAILAPYGKSIRNLIPDDFIQNYDDRGACSEDEKTCATSTAEIESALAFDSSQIDANVFPLRLTVTGKDNGKTLEAKVWTIPFDKKTWSYPMPANWILKDKTK